ncbi:secreted RxLR effector protein 161-like [Aegilops tauschii subsp. strangulata]|uniref:secreted RxLR effector protein 161-like n=1 Tax=Aegilops tauschii subsp. strangulata TaxID=200361 RepID=UPI001ABC5FF9|nr:secreted RxLR effector protein 161-like [Aegilops tauschii subsp. strangulata]
MAGCKACHMPMEPRFKLSRESTASVIDEMEYRSIVGSLRYLVHTRPYMTFSVGYVSRFIEAPTKEHLIAVKAHFEGESTAQLVGYNDSDLGGDIDNRKSTTGTPFLLGGGAVNWQSQKQKIMALSNCESEYVAATTMACQSIWLSQLLDEFRETKAEVVKLKVDSKSAITLAKNPMMHNRSKHIELTYHFIRDCLETKKIELDYMAIELQLADML